LKIGNLITSAPSNLRWMHPRMRAFSYVSLLPVTWQSWRLQNRVAVFENTALHANMMAQPELSAIEVSHCGNRNFRLFWLLWPWPWPDDLHIRTWPVLPADMSDV